MQGSGPWSKIKNLKRRAQVWGEGEEPRALTAKSWTAARDSRILLLVAPLHAVHDGGDDHTQQEKGSTGDFLKYPQAWQNGFAGQGQGHGHLALRLAVQKGTGRMRKTPQTTTHTHTHLPRVGFWAELTTDGLMLSMVNDHLAAAGGRRRSRSSTNANAYQKRGETRRLGNPVAGPPAVESPCRLCDQGL